MRQLLTFGLGVMLSVSVFASNQVEPTFKDWKPVKRTTEKIALVEKDVARSGKDSWQRVFFRNKAYKCGLSGYYTFVVIEPKNSPGKKAPLWVYLHGGGYGYFDKKGKYQTLKHQNKDTWNHEETFEKLARVNNGKPVFDKGRFVDVDTTLTRRVEEGYRVLVVSMGDHDIYCGMGTPYAHNPKGGEVNRLQATMAAVEYTVANYPTTHVFAHGTSAGSSGAFALGFAFAQEGINLNGLVMDSSIITPRMIPVSTVLAKNEKSPLPKNFSAELATQKIGVMTDFDYPFYPEAAVKAGFRSVPMLAIVGTKDPQFGGTFPTIAEAKAAGLSTSEWVVDGLRQAIKKQANSPHKLLMVNTGHVPTVDHKNAGHAVHNDVDTFIQRVTSMSKSYPFEKVGAAQVGANCTGDGLSGAAIGRPPGTKYASDRFQTQYSKKSENTIASMLWAKSQASRATAIGRSDVFASLGRKQTSNSC